MLENSEELVVWHTRGPDLCGTTSGSPLNPSLRMHLNRAAPIPRSRLPGPFSSPTVCSVAGVRPSLYEAIMCLVRVDLVRA